MRARLVGLGEDFVLRSYARSITSFASSSRVARPPQSILDWQHQLSLPSTPSPHPLFSTLYEALQAPFPPLKEPYAWIEARDVEKTLKTISSARFAHKGQEEKAKLDAIIRGINRCTANAKERIGYHIEQNLQRHGIHLSAEEKSAKVSSHPSIRAWENLQSSHIVRRSRMTLLSQSLRKPTQEDLLEALEVLDTLKAERSSFEELENFNRLLTLLVRQMPTLDESGKVKRFLELNIPPNHLQLDLKAVSPSPGRIGDLLKRVPSDDDDFDMDLPHNVLLVFQEVWTLMQERCRPDSASYGIALALETKLAPFRSISPRSTNIWDPVERLKGVVHEKGLLRSSHINQIMWAILRYDPNLNDSEGYWERVEWPSIDICQAYYEEMRGLVVQMEMQWEKMREARASMNKAEQLATPWESMRSASYGRDNTNTLPDHIIPTQRTYELLIKGFAWRGDLIKAAKILYEMTQSPVDSMRRLLIIKRGKVDGMIEKGKAGGLDCNSESITFKASIPTYDSLFRGFCKHSIPSNLIHYDADDAAKCHWEDVEKDENTSNDWDITSLVKIFEAFLDLHPKDCEQASNGYTNARIEGKRKGSIGVVSTLPDDQWLVGQDEDLINSWTSIISLQDPASGRERGHRGPTTQQLFNVLTALRRTSNDNPMWVLDQWQRIEDKFGCPEDDSIGRSNANEQGWTDWKVDARIRRVIEHLTSKL